MIVTVAGDWEELLLLKRCRGTRIQLQREVAKFEIRQETNKAEFAEEEAKGFICLIFRDFMVDQVCSISGEFMVVYRKAIAPISAVLIAFSDFNSTRIPQT